MQDGGNQVERRKKAAGEMDGQLAVAEGNGRAAGKAAKATRGRGNGRAAGDGKAGPEDGKAAGKKASGGAWEEAPGPLQNAGGELRERGQGKKK